MLAVEAQGLTKRYKEVVALDGVDLAVPRGTVLGLLGPNGAGRTTTVRVLTTLLKPDAGSARVAGVDGLGDPAGVRSRIGLSGQYAAVDEYLTGFENLEMVGRLYHLGRRRSRDRAQELLGQFGLSDAANRPAKTYSGGMRRRLDLPGPLVADPEVIFPGEPTTGLDPKARLNVPGTASVGQRAARVPLGRREREHAFPYTIEEEGGRSRARAGARRCAQWPLTRS